MKLKNNNVDISKIFEYTNYALGTDAELPMSNLISITCDLSDDNAFLKDIIEEIKKLIVEYPNNYILGEKVRELFKNM